MLKIDEVLQLCKAGYTKADIAQFEASGADAEEEEKDWTKRELDEIRKQLQKRQITDDQMPEQKEQTLKDVTEQIIKGE